MTGECRPPQDEPDVIEVDQSADRAALLARVDLFSGLDRLALAKLAASLDPVSFEDGEAACRQGEPGDSLFVIARGRLGVYVDAGGRETQVATMGEGVCFGEMALLTGEPRSATVRAQGGA